MKTPASIKPDLQPFTLGMLKGKAVVVMGPTKRIGSVPVVLRRAP